MEVRAVEGAIVATPVRRARGRVLLADLVAALPSDAGTEPVDWGVPEGDEVA